MAAKRARETTKLEIEEEAEDEINVKSELSADIVEIGEIKEETQETEDSQDPLITENDSENGDAGITYYNKKDSIYSRSQKCCPNYRYYKFGFFCG